MELSLISHHKDLHSICGFFIEDPNLEAWLKAIRQLGLNPSHIKIYALPSTSANVLWGCLLLTQQAELVVDLKNYPTAHRIGGKLIIPEKTSLKPELTAYDFNKLFRGGTYVLHPDVGLYKLTEPVFLEALIDLGNITTIHSTRPQDFTLYSGEIQSFSVEAVPKEQLKQELELGLERETFKDAPLTVGEKLRLQFYENFLITEEDKGGEVGLNTKRSIWEEIGKRLGFYGPDTKDRIVKDFRDLQERNKKEVDKLMDLLKEKPEEALRYAIPLDEHGYIRGEGKSEFKLQDRGLNFSLFRRFTGNQGRGGTVDLADDSYYRLQTQYELTAQNLKEKGNYEKAAYIYLKLLKNYTAAGETLRVGNHYEKAAYVFLEYAKNDLLAAACYEEGKFYKEAIALYEKSGKLEKVGDLYIKLGDIQAANVAYQALINKKLKENKYVQAAKIAQEKMKDLAYAKTVLLTGWKHRMDSYNCLSHYFTHLSDGEETWNEIQRVYREDVKGGDELIFLKVLKKEYAYKDENGEKIRNLAYTLISKLLEQGKVSSQELHDFNERDPRLQADMLRYELRKYNRG